MTLIADKRCEHCISHRLAWRLNYDPELIRMMKQNFQHIAELAESLNTGNVSHNSRVILGIAKRNVEYLEKKNL